MILIVEPHEDTREMLILLFESLGFYAIGVDNLDRALSLIRQCCFRFIILDLQKGRAELLYRLSEALVGSPSSPKVILTDTTKAVISRHESYTGFVKPVDPESLISACC